MKIYDDIPRSEIEIVISRNNEDLTLFVPFNNNIVIYNKGNNNINEHINRNNIINSINIGRENGTYLQYIINNYYNLPNYILFTQANPVEYINKNNELLTFEKIHEVFNEHKNYKFKYLSTNILNFDEDYLYDYTSGLPSLRIEYGIPLYIRKLINDIKQWLNENKNEKSVENLLNTLESMVNNDKHYILYYEFTELYEKDPWFMGSQTGINFRREISYSFNFDNILTRLSTNYTFGYGSIFIVNKSQILKYSKQFWENMYISFLSESPSASFGLEKMWRYLFE
jgi:hypothetical protein